MSIESDIAKAVLDALGGRKGFNGWYGPIDEETKQEIQQALEAAVSPMVEAFTARLADAEAAMLLYLDGLEGYDWVSNGIAAYLKGRGMVDGKCNLTPKGQTALAYVKANGLPKGGGR